MVLQLKEDKMGGARRTYGKKRIKFLAGKSEGRRTGGTRRRKMCNIQISLKEDGREFVDMILRRIGEIGRLL